MHTLAQSPGSGPLPPPDAAPYSRARPAPNWPLIDAWLVGLGLIPA